MATRQEVRDDAFSQVLNHALSEDLSPKQFAATLATVNSKNRGLFTASDISTGIKEYASLRVAFGDDKEPKSQAEKISTDKVVSEIDSKDNLLRSAKVDLDDLQVATSDKVGDSQLTSRQKRLRKGFEKAQGRSFSTQLNPLTFFGPSDAREGSEAADYLATVESVSKNLALPNLQALGVNPTDTDIEVAELVSSTFTKGVSQEEFRSKLNQVIPKINQSLVDSETRRSGLTGEEPRQRDSKVTGTESERSGSVNNDNAAEGLKRALTAAAANPTAESSKQLFKLIADGEIDTATGQRVKKADNGGETTTRDTNTQAIADSVGPTTDGRKEENVVDRDLREGNVFEKARAGLARFTGLEKIGQFIGDKITEKIVDGRVDEAKQDLTQLRDEGRITEEEFNAASVSIDDRGNEISELNDVSGKELAGSVVQLGATLIPAGNVVRGAFAGAKGFGKLFAFGAAETGGFAAAQDENTDEIVTSAITGGILAPAVILGGGALARGVGNKVSDYFDIETKATKLATNILQPFQADLREALAKGDIPESVKALKSNIQVADSFTDLKDKMIVTTKTAFEHRNKILKENNFKIEGNYLDPLKLKIDDLESNGIASPSEINALKEILERETQWFDGQVNGVDRLQAQLRKEALQSKTRPLLEKREKGNLALDEANKMVGFDAIRDGLKVAVEGKDARISDINSQYAGLKEAVRLLANREGLDLKADEMSLLQKSVGPIIELFTSTPGVGAAKFVSQRAEKANDSMRKMTTKLKKLSDDNGGAFQKLYESLKRKLGDE